MLDWSPAIALKRKMLDAAITDEDFANAELIDVGGDADVPDGLRWIWRAFTRLGESRGWIGGGMGAPSPAPIAFADVLQWSKYYGYDEDMTHVMEACIRELDRVYINHMAEQQKKKA